MHFQFRAHIIDTSLPVAPYAQTAAADLDGDGVPEFVLGRQFGEVYCYKCRSADRWTRFLLGTDSPSDVGGCVLDVDCDGRLDFVAGGAWYRNSGSLGTAFERVPFDPQLTGAHDVAAADLNGDGRCEVLTMSDQNDLRWYRIPEDPAQPWDHHTIGPPVHAGLSVGDVDGDGDPDVVRTDAWFENVRGDGTHWARHEIGPNTPPPPDFQPPFAFNATKSIVCDMDRDGKNDIVFTDAEIPGGRVWWMQNVDGRGTVWKRHEIPNGDGRRRGAYHSLIVRDFDGDGDLDVFTCEMEAVAGEGPPRWYIWENLDGEGHEWREHVIFDGNLGGHEAVAADFTGSGRLDIIAKPWVPRRQNAVGGKVHVVFLENMSR